MPTPDDIPRPLRDLSKEAREALSPLDINTGPYARAQDGYRQHTAMIRFAWHPVSVKRRIRDIADQEMRRKAKSAYKFLKSYRQRKKDCTLILNRL